jgi:hypothetical protein
MKIIAILFALLLSACKTTPVKEEIDTSEQEQLISLEEYCLDNECRRNKRVTFLTDKGLVDEVVELYWPVVIDNQLSLFPGDKVYIEADLIEGQFVNLKQVDEIFSPEKTFTFDFQQMEDEVNMTLSVKNPFSKLIKFHLDMIDFAGEAHQTSSCPVIAGGGVFEMWPHAIPELVVSNLRSLEDTEKMTCIY